ncbi:MAG: hypothetical protein J6X60_04765 [Ruminiclostridium sp.]|nr:hypothetical protein [Ruminiclostridium sp.]
MSSRKKKRNRPQNNSPAAAAAEKLTEQLKTDDDIEVPQSSETILAEYERKALEAEQRMAERLRASEKERSEKEKRISTPLNLQYVKKDNTAKASVKQDSSAPKQDTQKNETPKPQQNIEEDVKKFVPGSKGHKQPEALASESFSEAFSEDLSEFEDAGPENGAAAENEAAPQRPNKFYLVFAIFIIIMSVIGIGSTVNFCTQLISDIANRTELKNELALFLYPVVCVDPPDCENSSELPSTIIVESAIWHIILTGDNSNYEKQYNTYMYVPAVDVEYSVRSIFGNSVKIEHQTVGTMDITFTYIEDMNSYLVPINPHYTAYSPRIKDVSNNGDIYTVTVEYIAPSALAVEGIEFETTPQKTMLYTLFRGKNGLNVHSIKNVTRLDDSYAY